MPVMTTEQGFDADGTDEQQRVQEAVQQDTGLPGTPGADELAGSKDSPDPSEPDEPRSRDGLSGSADDA